MDCRRRPYCDDISATFSDVFTFSDGNLYDCVRDVLYQWVSKHVSENTRCLANPWKVNLGRRKLYPRVKPKIISLSVVENELRNIKPSTHEQILQKRNRLGMIHHENIPIYFLPHLTPLYLVKLGFTGVYTIFLISSRKQRLWYSLEPPRRGGSNEYPQSMFWAEIWKLSKFFLSENI